MTNGSDAGKCPIHEIFCPVHAEVQLDLRTIKGKQEARHCGSHEAQLHNVIADISELRVIDNDQWTAINQLRRMVYIGAGGVSVAAFFGSIIGQMVLAFFKR